MNANLPVANSTRDASPRCLQSCPPSLLTARRSPVGGMKVIVKNTFLNVVPQDEFLDDASPRRASGASTCMARLSEPLPLSFGVQSPRDGHVAAGLSPFALGELPRDADGAASAADSSLRPSRVASEESARQMHLQLRCGFTPSSAETQAGVGLAVNRTFIDEEGNSCVSLRLTLETNTAAVARPSKRVVVAVAKTTAGVEEVEVECVDAAPAATPSTRIEATPSTRIEVTPSTRTHTEACSPSEDGEEDVEAEDDTTKELLHKNKSSMVCRHWKQGFCLYEDKCRFMHPVDKMGKTKSESATMPRARAKTTRRCRTATAATASSGLTPLTPGLVQNATA